MASLSITALSNFFSEEMKSISKGENHYKSDHVESFFYNADSIRGQVHASMKEKYAVYDYMHLRCIDVTFLNIRLMYK